MRLVFAFVMSLLLFGGFLASGGSAGKSESGGGVSRNVDATPAQVIDGIRTSLPADGLALVSRADDGDRFRQVVPHYEMARDPKLAPIARHGDLILTAHVFPEGAHIRAGFATTQVAANYRIAVAPDPDGRGSLVTMTTEVEGAEGAEGEEARIAANLSRIIDGHGREMLSTFLARARASRVRDRSAI